MSTKTTICIDARLIPGEVGGIEQVVLGAARGLSSLMDGDEEYVFLTQDDGEWLRPYISGNCRIHALGTARPQHSLNTSIRDRFPIVRQIWHQVSPLLGRRTVAITDGAPLIRDIHPDLVHFVIQTGFTTTIPTIYSPHDLQQNHLPKNFTPRERFARNIRYQIYADQAHIVVALTQWGKQDIIKYLEQPAEKVQVIPNGNILAYYPQPSSEDLAAVRRQLSLPDRFLYFPAQTYPNKNHIGLVRALARLRADGIIVPVICSGRMNDHYAAIKREVDKLGLQDQVRFLGFVTPLEVSCLYRLSAGLIFPSLFEGWGQPVIEAFYSGTPVSCSNVTSLPEVAGNAALLFDPASVEAIATAIRQLWTDEALRERLIRLGTARANLFTWERTARLYRALYRKILNRGLTADDTALLANPLPSDDGNIA